MMLEKIVDNLRCPLTENKLFLLGKKDLRDNYLDLVPLERINGNAPPLGLTNQLLGVEECDHFFPVIEDFPVLLVPEILVPNGKQALYSPIDLQDKKYAEAYEEMNFYNSIGEDILSNIDSFNNYMGLGEFSPHKSLDYQNMNFPNPKNLWIDARHDSVSQFEAYQYLTPIHQKVFLQIGGSGSHAVKALLAGAKHAFLLTPMIGEAKVTIQLAKNFNLEGKLNVIIGVGEELPFASDSIDLIYSGGCFHHMRLDYVAIQLMKVLKKNGKFSGVDPWKTPLHTIGTRIIGKRETSVFCRPITQKRLEPLIKNFPNLKANRHGPFLRYLFIAFEKLHIKFPISIMIKIIKLDDWMGSIFNLRDKYGGSLVITGTK